MQYYVLHAYMVEVLWLEGTFWRLAVKIWQVYFLCLAPWVLFSAGLILIFCRGGLCFSLMNIILLLRKISQAQWKTECVKLWLKSVCQAVLFAWFSNVAVHLPYVKNNVKVHRFLTGFSQGLSQVFSQGKNSQGFSQGFAWVLTLWKLPFSQGLNSFTPCEKGVKNMWENMWNWTVHMFFHSLIHRFFTAFSHVFIQ